MSNRTPTDDERRDRRRGARPHASVPLHGTLWDGSTPPRRPPADLHAVTRAIASGTVAIEPKAVGVVRFALAHPVDVALGTAHRLAEACQVSPSVVTRLVKALGFARFADFRELFKQYVRSGCVGLEITSSGGGHEARIEMVD